MSLSDQIAADLDIFLNTDEFAEEHTIDGVTVVCVIDSDVHDIQFAATMDGGVWVSLMQLYAKTADLEALAQGMPKAGRTLTIDGKAHMVISVSEDMGMTRVALELGQS